MLSIDTCEVAKNDDRYLRFGRCRLSSDGRSISHGGYSAIPQSVSVGHEGG
ncbi:MAG: hypothetical protein FWE67_13955 [Planctomycetaceae bacterium]|nr:hypothetical protein [Planctomycetaceae bacterium]